MIKPGGIEGNRKRVLLIAYRDSRSAGGSLRVLETLAKSLPGAGFDVEVLFAYGDAGGVTNALACPVHLLHARGAYDILAWRRVRSVIRSIQPAIIQFVDNVNWIIMATAGTHVPRLLYSHGRTIWQKNRLKNWLIASYIYWACNGVVTISYGAKRSLVSLGLVSAKKAWVVPNGVDDRFNKLKNLTCERPAKQKHEITLGMACRLTAPKGVLDAVRLIHLLPESWRLVVAGEGPVRPELEGLIKSYNLDSRVSLLGNIEDMESFYQEIDYYLFLSRYEPFGLVFAEAMLAGIPVIGLRADGEYAESEYPLIDESVACLPMRGEIFDYEQGPTDEELRLLADKLLELEKKPDQRHAMIENARERVRSGFLATQQANRLADVYCKILEREG